MCGTGSHPQNPSKFDPIVFPEENAKRRLMVLENMLDQNMISQSDYDTALADDVYSEIEKGIIDQEIIPYQGQLLLH